MSFRSLSLLLVAILLMGGCEQANEQSTGPLYEKRLESVIPTYRLAIHPLHNPRKLTAAYQPLIDYLNEHITTVRFALEASRDYQAYEVKFRGRHPELLLPNPWQTLEAMKVGYRVIAMAGDAEDFKGVFIVRRDSGIQTVEDLKGKAVSYPSHTALAACIMPQRYLHDHGIDVGSEIENHYVGSQESSIMNALLGETSAGATWPPPWRLFQKDHPEEAAQLMVIWETPALMNNSVMVRDDIPPALAQQISHLIHALHETDRGRRILHGMETARFHAANDESYAQVRDFVARFEQDVRPVEQP